MDSLFDLRKAQFIAGLWELYPGWAVREGNHAFDSLLIVPDAAHRLAQLQFSRGQREALNMFEPGSLSPNQRTDLDLMRNYLDRIEWRIEHYREYAWNPASYNVGGGFIQVLNNRQLSPAEKLQRISARLEQVPAYYEAARQNITDPTLEHTELALLQSRGAIPVFATRIPDTLALANLDEGATRVLSERLDAALVALRGYISWLEERKSDLLSNGSRSYRLGKALYDRKFALEIQSDYSAREVYEKALAERDSIHQRMIRLADQVWEQHWPGEVAEGQALEKVAACIDRLSAQHVQPEEFLIAIERQIPELVDFVRDHNLLHIDASKPLVVRPTPLYMRGGGAGASISAPGPYDPKGNTYYNVTPLDRYSA
ncbi:MAG: DUF885 family protein, partial [Bacteroidota bacterium]